MTLARLLVRLLCRIYSFDPTLHDHDELADIEAAQEVHEPAEPDVEDWLDERWRRLAPLYREA